MAIKLSDEGHWLRYKDFEKVRFITFYILLFFDPSDIKTTATLELSHEKPVGGPFLNAMGWVSINKLTARPQYQTQ